MLHKNFTLVFILGFFTFSVAGQSIDPNQLEASIDALIPPNVNDSTPGLVVGVVQGGELIFSKGYGMANLTYGIANDPKMVYNIGSVTKQFLGYAFAVLHSQGKLSIDDPVHQYLEDWPEFEQTVTLHHLLTHTSGYREAYTMSNLAGRFIGIDRLSREECLKVVRQQPQLEFIPGARYTYNSTAWVILAEVFERVTGESAETWIEKNIFQPLGMEATRIETYVGEVIPNAAESYSYQSDQGYANEKSNRAIFGAADIVASVEDLAKWVNNYRTAEVGGEAASAVFLEPFILNDGIDSEYALGIGVDTYRGLRRYRHTGGHEAFVTQLSYYPDHDTGIILISNFGGRGVVPSTNIAELLLAEHMTPTDVLTTASVEVDKAELEKWAGLYRASTLNQTIKLRMDGDTLTLGSQSQLIPTGTNVFRIKGTKDEVTFETLADGSVRMAMSGNSRRVFSQVEPWNPSTDDLKAFEGNYWSDELETVYHLRLEEDHLSIHHRWLGEITLEPVAPDFFRTNYGFYVNFNRTEEDELTGLSVNSGRTLNVIFNRQN
ncbi:MAG: serine hydrolase domain-containing protein [Bacteroidota bacterium]